MLKHYIGEEFHMLLDPLPDSCKVDEYDKAKTALTNYFIPRIQNMKFLIFDRPKRNLEKVLMSFT